MFLFRWLANWILSLARAFTGIVRLEAYRSRQPGLVDLLNYGFLVDDGVLLGKDGSLLAGWFYRGKDVASSTEDERNYITARVNAALRRLGTGWASWHEAVRIAASEYSPPEASHFPDPVTRLIDGERRAQFMEEGLHYETELALVVQWTPPRPQESWLLRLFYSGGTEPKDALERHIQDFQKTLAQLEDTLSAALRLHRMGSFVVRDDVGGEHRQDELVNFLHNALTGGVGGVNLPPGGGYLDAVIGGPELHTSDPLVIGDRFVAVVGIEGFPSESYPGIFDALDGIAMEMRWSSRFIYFDGDTSKAIMNRARRRWQQRQRGIWAQVSRSKSGVVDEDAVLMTSEVEGAMGVASSGLAAFGYYTPVIVLRHRDREVLVEQARVVRREIERLGFATRIETVNATEAFLGSLPGHREPNVRRPMMHTLNLADLVPLASIWAGRETAPCPMYPAASPPLMAAATTGATPFWVNLHQGDVGHSLILGPTGSGKSTLLSVIAAQFRRYRGATIWAFDKGMSLFALTSAAGGLHYEIAGEGSDLAFCPLSELSTDGDVAWAEEWIATCYQLQTGQRPSPEQGQEIHLAIKRMADTPFRSLTDFVSTVQDEQLRVGLSKYTLEGSLGHLLDGREDGLTDGRFVTFELEELMRMGETNVLPVLLYLFRRFDCALRKTAGAPALLLLDEAWLMLGHPTFRAKINEWLKVLRKANCAVVLATQSLSDAVRSGILDVLQEMCPTKILLPNEEAMKGGAEGVLGPRDLYVTFGMNERELTLLQNATKKRDYYYTCAEGRRMFELGLGPVALSFVAASSKEHAERIKVLREQHGAEWPFRWLEERGVKYRHYQGARATRRLVPAGAPSAKEGRSAYAELG